MKIKFWSLCFGILLLITIISSFVFLRNEKNEESESSIREWKDLNLVEKTIAVFDAEGLEPNDYKKWYVENKNLLKSESVIGKIKYQLAYIPSEVMALKGVDPNLGELSDVSKQHDKWEYYVFSFEDTLGSSNPFAKDQLKKVDETIQLFMSFEMQRYLTLVAGTDTLPCIQFHYERTIGVTPRFQFMCAFETGNRIKGSRQLLFQDVLFQNGTVKINMDEEKLTLSPGILLK